MYTLLAILAGVLLDLCFGDPHWLPHPVVGMGKLINLLEKLLRRLFPKSEKGELAAGTVMAAVLPLFCFGLSVLILWLLGLVHPLLRFAVESFCCYQILAAKSLRDESMAVFRELKRGDLAAARTGVSRIVGRDTAGLDEAGVTKAAVETVAENTGDGVVAPLLFLAIGGAPLGFLYKAVNTMDSMVGYKNESYLYFGRAAAKLDDVLNWLPARLAGLLMVLGAFLCGEDGRGAWRIFRRDRLSHSSPNSAQTEAACAGALGIQLGGPSAYFGKMVEKPTIGDDTRPAVRSDIRRANRLMFAAAALSLVLFTGIRLAVLLVIR
ncbi:MAG: adenosylcobinamide-phosphate synthase CbiB [Oscillospiraceae bacterium]